VIGPDAPVGPETVAVKVMVDPSKADVEFATTPIVGVVAVTEVVFPEVGVVAK